jgi:DNA-binding PadR family transcriptional regulator
MATSDRGVVGRLALGLLLDGPASGYELWQRAERSVAHFWPVTRSALYAELPRLREQGLITSTTVAQRDHPDKQVHEATPAGRRAFADWLVTADLAERARHPRQLQLFFAAHAPTGHGPRLLATWRAEAEQARDRCAAILAGKEVGPEQIPRDPRLLTALFGLHRARADLAFLELVAPVLDPPGTAPAGSRGGMGA